MKEVDNAQSDVPAWLIELVEELLNSFPVDYPLGWQAYSQDPPLGGDDGLTYEIHVWPALGVDRDGEPGWEAVTYPLGALLGMFQDTEVHVGCSGVVARTGGEAKTDGARLVWVLHFEPPANICPNHRRLGEGRWEMFDPDESESDACREMN